MEVRSKDERDDRESAWSSDWERVVESMHCNHSIFTAASASSIFALFTLHSLCSAHENLETN